MTNFAKNNGSFEKINKQNSETEVEKILEDKKTTHITNSYSCETNDDCVLIAKGCCIFVSINKKYRDEIEVSANEALDAACYQVCNAKAICKNNICEIKE